jgi:hypothetical protein
MRRIFLTLTVLSLLAFLGGASLFAQQTGGTGQTAPPKHALHHAHHMVHHAGARNTMARYQIGVHTLSGTLTTVDPNGHLVIVTDSNGTPFDFVVTHLTRIEINGKRDRLSALADQSNQQVTVKFRDDLRSGLRAESVQLGG